MVLLMNSINHVMKKLIPISLILLEHTKEGMTLNPYYDTSIIVIPENVKDITKMKIVQGTKTRKEEIIPSRTQMKNNLRKH